MNAIQSLIAENERRNSIIFSDFDPYSGKGCPGERTLVEIKDFPIRRQLMPRQCLKNRELKRIIRRGNIKDYIIYDLVMGIFAALILSPLVKRKIRIENQD